jgi:Zn-finger nucleic acid-binding protein
MKECTLDGVLGRTVAIDLCQGCQGFWFDGHESLQLAPSAVLALFRLIGTRAARPGRRETSELKCPRCRTPLQQVKDKQRTTQFEYLKCPREHGRFISFVEFLKKKDFIKPLSAAEIQELRRRVQFINCDNCGAAVDLVKSSECAHCGTPLSMLDIKHAEQLIAQLRDAEKSNFELRTPNPPSE